MSGEPAIRKVLVRTKEWLDDVSGSGVSNYIDRPFDQPFRDSDFPLVNIRCQRVDFDTLSYSAWLHTAQIMFDIITRSSTIATIDNEQAVIAARIVARMAAKTGTAGTIGEVLQDAIPLAMGGGQDEYDMADHGESTFAWRFTYLTPINDFCTIAGASGPVP